MRKNKNVKALLNELHQRNSPIIGKVKYLTVWHWEEHKIPLISELDLVIDIYCFIQQAIKNFQSCLVVSYNNKCGSVLIATVYLMFKYKWSLHKTFEFLNNRKTDIELTK